MTDWRAVEARIEAEWRAAKREQEEAHRTGRTHDEFKARYRAEALAGAVSGLSLVREMT